MFLLLARVSSKLFGSTNLLNLRAKLLTISATAKHKLISQEVDEKLGPEFPIFRRIALSVAAIYLTCPISAWFLPHLGAALAVVSFCGGNIVICSIVACMSWRKYEAVMPENQSLQLGGRTEAARGAFLTGDWPNIERHQCERPGDPGLAAILFAVLIVGLLLWVPCSIASSIKTAHFVMSFDLVDVLALSSALLLPLSSLLGAALSGARMKLDRRCSPLSNRIQGSVREFLAFDYPFLTVLLTFFICCFLIGFYPSGVGDSIASWLGASLNDAMRSTMIKPDPFYAQTELYFAAPPLSASEYSYFAGFIHVIVTMLLILGLLPRALKAAVSYAKFARRLSIVTDINGLIELCAVKLKSTIYVIKDDLPWLRNSARTFWWLVICWAALFCLVAFCPGPLGLAIINWLAASAADANIKIDPIRSTHFRMFLASVIALYGAAPLAITACAFLPSRKLPELIVDSDGMLFSEGFLARMLFRPYRRWTDLKQVDVAGRQNSDWKRWLIKMSFRTGGILSLKASWFEPEQLASFLSAIDECAESCSFSERALQYLEDLNKSIHADKYGDRVTEGTYRSTIFEPFAAGHRLKAREMRIIRLLNTQPSAATYLVRTRSQNLAVLKQFVVPKDTEKNHRLQKQFEREYRILSSVNHPNICKILDVFEEDGISYLVLQHMNGRDLRKIVEENGARLEEQVIGWANQIAEIMLYLHSQSPPILHRDLTPDNLILADDGSIKLIDFGAAHHFMEGVTGTLIGKQCYMAPEQLRGKATVRSDIYSLGATLAFLLTGKEPRSLAQSSPKNADKTISNQLNELIMRCTAFDEEQRPQSFQEVLAILGSKESSAATSLTKQISSEIKPNDNLECIANWQSKALESDTSITAERNDESGLVLDLRSKTGIEVE
jgi:hypothetical protein